MRRRRISHHAQDRHCAASCGLVGIGPIAIKLTQAGNLVVLVGHQHRILIAGDALAILAIGLDAGQQLLAVIRAGDHDLA